MKWFRNIFSRVRSDVSRGENLDSYIAICAGAVVTVLGIFGGLSQGQLNASLVLVLTLVVVNVLRSRHLLQDTTESFLNGSPLDASLVLRDRSEYSSLEDRLNGASEVYLFGQNLLGFIGFSQDILRRYARLGCTFRILLFDESISSSLETRADLRTAMRLLEDLRRESPSGFEIRKSAIQFPSSIFAVDIHKPKALIQVQPHSLYADDEFRPHFDLRAVAEDPRWFEYFRKQIEQLWINSPVA